MQPINEHALSAAMALNPREEDFLRHFQTLSRRYPPEVARTALEQAILRRKARAKYPPAMADRMFFTREALEQATPWLVAVYRAARYAGRRGVVDLGCSIGGDTLALAAHAPVVGLDRDPKRLLLAQDNVRAIAPRHPVALVQADLLTPLPLRLPPDWGLFFDPARRARGRRTFSVHDYHPPLTVVREWQTRTPALGVKVSPGVKLDELRGFDCEVEFISWKGELKEAALWFGPLKTAVRRATLLPGPHTLTAEAEPDLPLSEPRAFMYEPDPAVIRAGLVRTLGAQLDAAQLDPQIAYLTADRRVNTPFARCWQVEDWLPFQLKRLRATLRERGVGRVAVKKRGSPIEPQDLIRRLKLQGDRERVLFLTRLRGRPIVIIGLAD